MLRKLTRAGQVVPIALMLLTTTYAGIPEPPVVLFGQVILDGRQVRAADDVHVVARVNEAPQPVGQYDMGDNSAAGDDYVLMLRIESAFDGQPQSADAANVGQTADLFLRVADGPERPAGQYQIAAGGVITNHDLNVTTAFGQCADEVEGVGLADAAKFAECMSGVNGSVALDCGCADANADGDSDLEDWASLQNNFNGQQ